MNVIPYPNIEQEELGELEPLVEEWELHMRRGGEAPELRDRIEARLGDVLDDWFPCCKTVPDFTRHLFEVSHARRHLGLSDAQLLSLLHAARAQPQSPEARFWLLVVSFNMPRLLRSALGRFGGMPFGPEIADQPSPEELIRLAGPERRTAW